MGTLDEVGHVYEKAKEVMRSREEDYGDTWRREGIRTMVGSLFRKASGTKYRFDNGVFKKNIPKTKEDLLDEMNYCALCYKLLEEEELDEART